ncbi:polypeptide deformylase [Legionella busanensis]|uniref:Peptide deformylase n=1 Tax=Legionella busanensis TaxID=190655 RepID=A0A378JH61_9GAMM|nr:peptide deformylase [Legionella busanensis]STX50141.1 polypeptide deformylase [Legionella busanensis]
MKEYEVIQLGNPLLRTTSEAIEDSMFGSEELKNLEDVLFNALKRENGLGLAAPQLGITKRALVFGMDKHPVYTQLPAIPFTVIFNPSFEPLSDVMEEAYEGCISVGQLRGKVPRYKHIGYRGYDAHGKLIEREVSDLHARVLQHELDHLNGIIFLDRVTNHNSLGFRQELIQCGALPA